MGSASTILRFSVAQAHLDLLLGSWRSGHAATDSVDNIISMQTERDKRNPKGKVRKGQILLYSFKGRWGKGTVCR
jgi:hypothetical protein